MKNGKYEGSLYMKSLWNGSNCKVDFYAIIYFSTQQKLPNKALAIISGHVVVD